MNRKYSKSARRNGNRQQKADREGQGCVMRHRPRGEGNLREVVLELASLISLTTLCPEFQKLNFTPRTSFTRCAQILLLSRSLKEQTTAEMVI